MTKTFHFTLHGNRVAGKIETDEDGFCISINNASIAGISSSGSLLVYHLTPEGLAAAETTGLCIDKDKKRIHAQILI